MQKKEGGRGDKENIQNYGPIPLSPSSNIL
jgi:hypothetical protein